MGIDEEKRNEAYNRYVERVTPKANCMLNMVKAFVVGGAICLYGQVLLEVMLYLGVSRESAGLYSTVLLVLTSVLLTGFNIYPRLANWGGAGSLVPITGFANSVAAPAIEYKKEGQVFGIGCKIFTIAGPVILYGIVASWIVGLVYWIVR